MKTLVIGTSGQLGRALDIAAPEFTCLGRSALDLLSPAEAEATIIGLAPDLVINAAAYTAVDQAESDAQAAFAVNRDGVAALARGAARSNAALVHVSTDYVFDGTKAGPWTEADAANPLGVYGASKLAGEIAAAEANPRTLILRTSWLYSPWGRNFVTTMLGLADRQKLRVVDDQTGNPTSAQDLAAAIVAIAPRLAALPAGSPLWGVYHYAGRGTTSWAGFAREIFAQVEGKLALSTPEIVPIPASEYPTLAQRPVNSALDCGAFERGFGVGMIDWHGALARVVGQIVKNGPKRGAVA